MKECAKEQDTTHVDPYLTTNDNCAGVYPKRAKSFDHQVQARHTQGNAMEVREGGGHREILISSRGTPQLRDRRCGHNSWMSECACVRSCDEVLVLKDVGPACGQGCEAVWAPSHARMSAVGPETRTVVNVCWLNWFHCRTSETWGLSALCSFLWENSIFSHSGPLDHVCCVFR